jgi:hypothetical protein
MEDPMKTFRAMLLFLATLATLAGCGGGPSADEEFTALAGNYLESMLAMNPEWATSLGDHRFDGEVSDMSAAGFAAAVAFNAAYLDSLAAIDPEDLSVENRIDWEILRDQLEYQNFMITEVAAGETAAATRDREGQPAQPARGHDPHGRPAEPRRDQPDHGRPAAVPGRGPGDARRDGAGALFGHRGA